MDNQNQILNQQILGQQSLNAQRVQIKQLINIHDSIINGIPQKKNFKLERDQKDGLIEYYINEDYLYDEIKNYNKNVDQDIDMKFFYIKNLGEITDELLQIDYAISLRLLLQKLQNYYSITDINNILIDYYTVSQIDSMLTNLLLLKLDKSVYDSFLVDYQLFYDEQQIFNNSIPINYYNKTYIDALISNYYNKSYIDTLISNYYTKTQIDTNYYTSSYIDTLISNYYNKSYIDTLISNYYTSSYIDTLISNYYTKTYIDTLISDYYTKTQIDTIRDDYYTKTYIDTNYYTKTQIDTIHTQIDDDITSGLVLKQDDILSNITHSANQVLSMNATNTALIFTNPGSTDIESYMTSLTGFTSMRIFTHNGGIFQWLDISNWDVATVGDLVNYYTKNQCDNGFCQKLLSIQDYQEFRIPNNSNQIYHFKVQSSAYDYLYIYYNNTVLRNDNYYFYNLAGTQIILQLNPSYIYTKANVQTFYNTAGTQYYMQLQSGSNYYKNNQHYYINSAGTTTGLIGEENFIKYSAQGQGNCEIKTYTDRSIGWSNCDSIIKYNISTNDIQFQSKNYSTTYLQIKTSKASGQEFGLYFMNNGSMLGSVTYDYAGTACVTINHLYNSRVVEFEYNNSFVSYINTSGTITTSDKNKKYNIINKKDKCFSCYFSDIGSLFNQYQYLMDEHNNVKLGYIAQDIIEFQQKYDIEELKNSYEIVNKPCVDQYGQQHQQQYGLDYNQVNIFIIKTLYDKIQQQQQQIDKQQQCIEQQQQQINRLQQMVQQQICIVNSIKNSQQQQQQMIIKEEQENDYDIIQ